MKLIRHFMGITLVLCVLAFLPASGSSDELFNEGLLKAFPYRALGPARQGGRVVDFAVPESQPYTFYVAAATGGLGKTVNNGTTFEPIFDNQSVIAIGDIAVASSNPDIIWVGTGEANSSRTCYWGDGVYKSADGGKSWNNMGLKDSHHIGRIVIHPKNPNIVYVAALGHLYSVNEERGLFKTTNGGKTWEKVLYVNEKLGVVDVAMSQANPNILYAATYEKQRLPWHFEQSGPGSAIYKTTNAGKTWTKLRGGLPRGNIGRIGLDIFQKNPNIVYAAVENSNTRSPTSAEARYDRERKTMPRARIIGGEIYRTDNAGKTWKKMNSKEDDIGGRPGYYYGQIRVDPNDDKVVYVLGVTLHKSVDGGKSWDKRVLTDRVPQMKYDHHALWIDPGNSNHLILGSDGGVSITYDGGKSWDLLCNLPFAQVYAVGVDMEDPYNVYCGLQDNGSWKGPSNTLSGRITQDDWISIGRGDGFYNQVDPNDSRWLYNESQFGNIQRVDQKLGIRKKIRPRRKKGKPSLRFNWNTPIFISPHNSLIVYLGSNVLFRSMNRGDDWQEISPDLTSNDKVKMAGKGNIQYCSITTISESPVTPGIIWVGTDDGKVHLTRNGGAAWTDLTGRLSAAGAPEDYWVSRAFASNFHEGTAYVSKTGYRRDDFRPFLYRTTDFGESWTSISNNLPDEAINVIAEDRKNPKLIFIGTEMAVYVSIDGGEKWIRMKNNMPTIPVHDLLIHPRENDLVVGTHGRGIFTTDITPLQEMSEEILKKDAHFFSIEPKTQWITTDRMPFQGHRNYSAQNEPYGLVINYYLKDKTNKDVWLTITDYYGEKINSLRGGKKAGINKLIWQMRTRPSRKEIEQLWRSPDISRMTLGELVSPGDYVVTLSIGDKKLTQIAQIKK